MSFSEYSYKFKNCIFKQQASMLRFASFYKLYIEKYSTIYES